MVAKRLRVALSAVEARVHIRPSGFYALTGLAVLAIALVHARPIFAADVLELNHISHRPRIIDPNLGEVFRIQFSLVEPVRVALEVYDDRGLLVTKIDGGETWSVGDHELVWAGRDSLGRVVPAEAYEYLIVGRRPGQDERLTYAPATDRVGSRTTWIDGKWDPISSSVRYQLAQPSRVQIRAGLARGGPLLKTILDWVPRVAGSLQEPWDGFDSSRVMNFSDHPNLRFSVSTFQLPGNSLIVGPPAKRISFIDDLPRTGQANRLVSPEVGFEMFDFANQNGDQRGDVEVGLEVRSGDGATNGQVSGEIEVSVDANSVDAARLLNERFEVVFYIDGRLEFETEIAFLPFTWVWDARRVALGEHLLTVNLRGFDGHFGIASRKLNVIRQSAASN